MKKTYGFLDPKFSPPNADNLSALEVSNFNENDSDKLIILLSSLYQNNQFSEHASEEISYLVKKLAQSVR